MTNTFKVGDKVRLTTSKWNETLRRGTVGEVVEKSAGWVYVGLLDNRGRAVKAFPCTAAELELVKPEPLFAIGDRVELAGVAGEVTSHGSICVAVKWDDGHIATFDNAGDILKQLKKLPPEQVFVTGAWYKDATDRPSYSLFRLTLEGWKQLCVTATTAHQYDIKAPFPGGFDLVEVDFPL